MTTKILILGGGGMVGQKLVQRLMDEGLAGHDALQLTLFDMGFPSDRIDQHEVIVGSVMDTARMSELAARRFDMIFHLASIVSGEAENNFTKGWHTNMLPMWHFLEALAHEHKISGGEYVPRVVFTSSIAVFGAPFPEKIDDEFLCAPQTSYGAQKACCELMLTDVARKGFVEGISLRLPTVCVRPGKPNLAASGFFSGIIREPLNGMTANLPVADTVRHWMASPRAATGFLTHAATMDLSRLEGRPALNMPGLSITIAGQIEALRRVAGQKAVDLITTEPDEAIRAIVKNWPENFVTQRALDLGFVAETEFDEIIRIYIEDEMTGGVM